MKHTEIALPLKVAEKRPVDRRAVFPTLAEAYTEAYPGMACYIEETGKYYLFLLNNDGDLFASDQFPDLRPYAKITDLQNAIAELINGSPAMLDTLYELANAINNDPNFATAIFNQLNTKVDKVVGKGLSESDFTLTEKNKLAGIESGANNYTHPANHPASIITQDANNRFVSDAEKANWNNSIKIEPNGESLILNQDYDVNCIDKTGFYRVLTGSNTPFFDWWYVINMKHSDSWMLQEITCYGVFGFGNLGKRFRRYKKDGVWLGWISDFDENNMSRIIFGDSNGRGSIDGVHQDNITKSGFYRSNIPPLSQFLHVQHPLNDGYAFQIGNDYSPDDLHWRAKDNGNWGSLKTFVHSGNFKNQAIATTSANGLMSAPDKAKLDRATGVKVSYQSSAPANPQFGDIWIIP